MLNRYRAVFRCFASHDVKYVVIGGIAAILHGVPRTTFDVDVLIEPSRHNAESLLRALEEAGMGTALLTTPDEVLANEITVFQDVLRIDVQTRTPGLDFATAWAGRQTKTVEGEPFFVVSLPDLLASKRAAGRPVDLEDVRLLESRRNSAGS